MNPGYRPDNRIYQQQSGEPPVTIGRVAPSDRPVEPIAASSDDARPGRRMRVFLIVSGTLALLTVAAWAFGGLDARPSGPKRVKPGSTVNQGLFGVEVLDARAGRMRNSSFQPASNQLVVRVRVTNLGRQSYGITSFVNGVAARPRPGTFVAPDLMKSIGDVRGHHTSTIHPRLPVTVELVWPLPEATTPHTVVLALREWSYGQSFTTDTFGWTVGKDSPVQAEVPVPVRTGATS